MGLTRAWMRRGLIPAHAGKTRTLATVSSSSRAHPRSRGENTPTPSSVNCRAGSSPLTRGKPFVACPARFGPGLIPAHAGKTEARREPGSGDRAHPRSRGENYSKIDAAWGAMGSSPLTRGKPRGRPGWLGPEGLIPAHAGKTWRCGRTPAGARAHPRSRGENLAAQLETVGDAGSSPLPRGKHRAAWIATLRLGLIPAHAGKTARRSSPSTPARAHPRSRGEKRNTRILGNKLGGSSPLTRGKRTSSSRRA